MKSSGIIVSALFLAPCLCAAAEAGVEARVRVIDGTPQICVDGEPVPPRMFWGRRGTCPSLVGKVWRSFDFTFTPDADVARGNVHFRFDKTDGGVVRLRNFRLSAGGETVDGFERTFDAPADFKRVWKIWPPRNDYVHAVSNGVCEVQLHPWRLPGNDPDYHFYTVFRKFKAGVKYRLQFEAQGLNGCRWIMPGVYSVASNGHHTAVPLEGQDSLVETVSKAASAGVDFVSYGIPEVWKEDGDDFSAFDAVTDSILKANPRALLIPRVSVNAPEWWLARNPDHRMQFAAEHVNNKGGSVWSHELRPKMAAVSSRPYRAVAKEYIVRVIRHMQDKYPRNFAGIHPTGQNTSEWFYFDSWNKMNGYDPQTRAAFRKWLGDPSAEVPTCAERMKGGSILLDTATQARCLAFNRFQQEEMSDFVAELARTCRKATGGRKLVVFFYGYAWEFAAHRYGAANSGHYGMENLLRKADGAIDILCSPISYYDRAFCGSAPNMSAGETVMHSGVLWLNEDDTRTHLDHRASKYVQEGSLVTCDQSRRVMLRNTAQEAVRGFGSWWMDLPGWGWYNSKELWEVQRALMPLERAMCRRKLPFSPELAIVQDEESMLHLVPPSFAVGGRFVGQPRASVNRSGVPHGQYLLFDALRKPLPAKVVFFQSCWCLSDADVKRLREQAAERPDQLRVWCWAAGWQNEEGVADLTRMGTLTGFRMARHDVTKDARAIARPAPAGVAAGLKKDGWYGQGPHIDPLFTVTDARPNEVWATYPNGDPAIAVRGNNVFMGVPAFEPDLVWALAAKAGAHRYLPQGEAGRATLWATPGPGASDGCGVLEIQALEDGTFHVQLPSTQVNVYDAITGEKVGAGPVVELKMAKGDVRVLRWTKDEERK